MIHTIKSVIRFDKSFICVQFRNPVDHVAYKSAVITLFIICNKPKCASIATTCALQLRTKKKTIKYIFGSMLLLTPEGSKSKIL